MNNATKKIVSEKQKLEYQSEIARSIRSDVLSKINQGTNSTIDMIKWYSMLEEIESFIFITNRKIESAHE